LRSHRIFPPPNHARQEGDGDGNCLARAYRFASEALAQCPPGIRWKICHELADLAKRQNMLADGSAAAAAQSLLPCDLRARLCGTGAAREWFDAVHALEPQAVSGWIEHAKLEEECGRIKVCVHFVRRLDFAHTWVRSRPPAR
jgi:hypothetical protein